MNPSLRPAPRAAARPTPVVLAFAACAAAAVSIVAPLPLRAGDVVERILVQCNSRIVTQGQFDARISAALKESGPLDSARQVELKKAMMEELVHEALLEDRARELEVVATEAEVDEQIKRLKEQNSVSTDEQFSQALAASGLTIDKLRDQLRKSITVQRVVGREVHSKVDLSDDALRGIYEREKEQYRIPEKARVSEILVSPGPGSEQRAKEASEKLKGGMKWESAVPLYSDGSTKGRAGDLGWVTKGDLAADLDKVVFSQPIGTPSEPVLTKSGWHIVKVVDKQAVSYKPFAEVRADILKREQETQFQKKLAEYFDRLQREAVIRVAPEAEPYYTAPPPVAPETIEPVNVPKKKG